MDKLLKVVCVFGTRPEAIKMAPVVKRLQAQPELACKVAVTAQHRQMLDQVLELFHIKPDYDLDIMKKQQTLFDVTTRALTGLEQVFAEERPDLVLVHGDTTTTFAAALAAFYRRIPVGHVEAGLRTGNIYSPFPEEMNRKLAGAIADVHFAPTGTAKANLMREGVKEEAVYVTGNTVIDALYATVRPDYSFKDPVLSQIDFSAARVLLVTTHRRENLGEPMRSIYLALKDILERFPDTAVVFPVHKNPLVRRVAEEVLGDHPRAHLIEPLDYEPFVHLMSRSFLVLTDSGGLQEEAPALGKPVLVLRDTTERPEAVIAGTVKLVGTDYHAVLDAAATLLADKAAYDQMAHAVNPYGDGKAAGRICQAILHRYCGLEKAPEEFLVNCEKKEEF